MLGVTTNPTGGPGEHQVGAALRALVAGSETRLALVLATVVVGAGTAFVLAFILQPSDRTLTAVAPLVQIIMSVLTPLSTAVLTYDLRDPMGDFRSRTTAPLRARWIAAGLYGLGVGVVGVVLAAVAVAVLVGADPPFDPWAGALSTAHTLLHYARFGKAAFRERDGFVGGCADGGRAGCLSSAQAWRDNVILSHRVGGV